MTPRPPDPETGRLLTGPVTIELTNAEALVLFEFLARSQGHNPERYELEHQAEQRVLWDVQAMLESVLVEPINRSDYGELVETARAEVADSGAVDA